MTDELTSEELEGTTDDYHPRSKRTRLLHVRISDDDRARLVRLSRHRRQSGAEVIRALIEAAAGELP